MPAGLLDSLYATSDQFIPVSYFAMTLIQLILQGGGSLMRKQFYPLFSLTLALTLTLILTIVLQHDISQAAPAVQTDGQVYIVKSGDSLYKISGQLYG